MKKLKTVLALPLILAMSCKPIINPNPIVINNPPITNLSISPESGCAPVTAEISLTGADLDEDEITEYKLMIDTEDDGIIDETVIDSNPITINRTFDNVGRVRIYGRCTDEHGLNSNRKNIEFIVSEPTPGNVLPTIKFSVSSKSGLYPLTSDISLEGEDSDGTITEYKLEFDYGTDGTIDETITDSKPINISKTFDYDKIGTTKIRGTVTDDKEGKATTSTDVEVIGRNDLSAKISFEDYHIGSYFDFVGEVENLTGNNLYIDNSNGDSLEYLLIKEGGTKPILDRTFDKESQITLYNDGKLNLNFEENEIYFSFCNAKISIFGMNLGYNPESNPEFTGIWIGPVGFPNPGYVFTESGMYHLEIIAKYSTSSMGGETYKQKLTSSSFEVE